MGYVTFKADNSLKWFLLSEMVFFVRKWFPVKWVPYEICASLTANLYENLRKKQTRVKTTVEPLVLVL